LGRGAFARVDIHATTPLRSLQLAEQFRNPVREKLLSYRFAIDPGLAVLCYKAFALWFLGFPDQAAQVREQVRVELLSHSHANTVATCNFIAISLPELMSGEAEACEVHSAELVTYATEKKVEQFRLVGVVLHACARATREPTEEKIAALRAAMQDHHRSGARITDSLFMCFLAQVLLGAGLVKDAEEALQEAFVTVEQSRERFWLAELHRIGGGIALMESDPLRAEACFLRAIEIARQQEARLLELRAATDLARLWRETGSLNDPRELLEPILAAIEGGETTRDVRHARALLVEAPNRN
jgi:tetratricopeptide (TPR) repeat protein